MSLRTLLRPLRHLPDRLLHQSRRRRALQRLHRGQPLRSVVFVCEGNIYRSPFAAAVFRDALPERVRAEVRVTSAGFVGPDRASPADAVALAARGGIDLMPHRSSLIDPERVAGADLVVVMDAEQRRRVLALGGRAGRVVVLGDLDPRGILTRAIVDPWKQQEGILEESYGRVERCTRELARHAFAASLADRATK